MSRQSETNINLHISFLILGSKYQIQFGNSGRECQPSFGGDGLQGKVGGLWRLQPRGQVIFIENVNFVDRNSVAKLFD